MVATPEPWLVTLVISSGGEETFSEAGSPRNAIYVEIKIELVGVAGVVAPLIAKGLQIFKFGSSAGKLQHPPENKTQFIRRDRR